MREFLKLQIICNNLKLGEVHCNQAKKHPLNRSFERAHAKNAASSLLRKKSVSFLMGCRGRKASQTSDQRQSYYPREKMLDVDQAGSFFHKENFACPPFFIKYHCEPLERARNKSMNSKRHKATFSIDKYLFSCL